MTNITRLHLRKNTYYIRISVPNSIKDLVKKNEIKYSLKTNNYFAALSKLRLESAKIEMYFSFVRDLKMKLDGNFIILTDDELDKVLAYRLRIIDDFLDNNYKYIKYNKYGFDDIGLFTQKKVDEYNEKHRDPNIPDKDDDIKDSSDINFIKATIQDLLFEYLDWLSNRPDTTLSINNFVDKIKTNNGIFFQITQNDENSERKSQMVQFYRDLLEIDKSANGKIENILYGKKCKTTSKIRHLLDGVRTQKRNELSEQPRLATKWQDVYEDMVRPLKHNQSVDESYLKTKKQCLETIFEIIDKQYVEQITFDDCRKISKLIYCVPKKWKAKYPNRKLQDLLLEGRDKSEVLSAASVVKYICHFQDLLRYCRRQGLINADMSDIFDKPNIDKNKNVWQPFDTEDLIKIFNPKTYFKREKNKDNHKFWIPLIALYSGMRLNEICQLKTNDIKSEKNIDYIQITDEGEDQSVKNYASARRVPIHPFLKQLGLMEQINFVRKQKQERLFYSLTYTEKSKYAGIMSNAFRYYMDKRIGITDKKKVFHSFRHLARVTLYL